MPTSTNLSSIIFKKFGIVMWTYLKTKNRTPIYGSIVVYGIVSGVPIVIKAKNNKELLLKLSQE